MVVSGRLLRTSSLLVAVAAMVGVLDLASSAREGDDVLRRPV
jgi:hypothetical protein